MWVMIHIKNMKKCRVSQFSDFWVILLTLFLPIIKTPRNICVIRSLKVNHYNDVITGVLASQITSLTSVYSIVYSGVDQRKQQSSALLTFVWGIHRGPVNSPHKWPVTRKMFPFDDVIMKTQGELVVARVRVTWGGVVFFWSEHNLFKRLRRQN